MPTIAALTSFTANTQAKAAEVNANFSTIRTTVNTYCAFVDTSATISGAWTFSTAPTFSNAQTFGAAVTITTGGLTVSAGGITVTGNSTITGTLGGLTGLTVASGGASITGNSSVTGTLTATTFSGSGASLTSLPAANLTGTLPAISGANLTSLNATNLASGTVDNARLPATISGKAITSATSVQTAALSLTNNEDPITLSPSSGATGELFVFNSNALGFTSTGTTAITTFTGQGPAAINNWRWIRVDLNGTTGYIPVGYA